MNDVSSQIRQYLATSVLFEANPAKMTDRTELIGHLVDSLGLMQLVAFVEEEFGIAFEDAEVNAENFATLGDMERLVFAKIETARIA